MAKPVSYFLELKFGGDAPESGEYRILRSTTPYRPSSNETVVFSRPHIEGEDLGEYYYPVEVRKEYEKLTGKPEFSDSQTRPFNIVPALMADDDDVVYDCPCAWAQHVKGHAVYCENSGWLYSPRKCRRGPGAWDGDPPQESCPGFAKNEHLTADKKTS